MEVQRVRIIFICTGNTCRSPMAEALTKTYIPNIEVMSAGLFAMEGGPANEHAIHVLKEKDIHLNHRSQTVSKKLIDWADIVLTMTTQHKQSLIFQYPDDQDKYFALKEYVADVDNKVWEEIKRAYADIEEKKLKFRTENERKLDEEALEKALTEHLYDDLQKVRKLEEQIDSYDIADPFGGDLNLYRATCEELEENIKLLREKVNGRGK